ncbi:MAG: S1C family serine protease [Candidatus Doudnabacteria bacterium]|nr:S1C family serine protease [Candidatus Doudnabacteria bacterium]
MNRIFATLNLITFVLLGIGVLNISKSVDFEGTIYSLNWFLRDRISQVSNRDIVLPQTIEGSEKRIAQASESVVPVLIYQEVPIYQNSNYHFFDALTTRIQVGSGTGFFITSDGYLLTNKHVVDENGMEYWVNVVGNVELPAEVVYTDPVYDLAVLKISGEDYPILNLGDSGRLRMGESVSTIGNAYGEFVDSISSGSISAVNRSAIVSDRNGDVERMRGLIQTTAKLYPGDSGGPLLNAEGQVIGVNVASAIGEDISFSIPVNTAKDVLDKAGIPEI